ncbi:MAG: radical SAM protein [Magnetococcales bacterium]|nr:radical SAM protein [Magnetococcales bacterium]
MGMTLHHEPVMQDLLYSQPNGQPLLKIGALSRAERLVFEDYPPFMAMQGQGTAMVEIGRGCHLADPVHVRLYEDSAYRRIAISPLAPLNTTGDPAQAAPTRSIRIGHDVWIGSGVQILNPVMIGHGAIIEAMSVIMQDVPPYAIVSGNPASIRGYRFSSEQISALLGIAWWEWSGDRILACKELLFSDDIDTFIQTMRGATPQPSIPGPGTDLVAQMESVDYCVDFSALTTIQVEISSACNLQCPQCFNRMANHVTKVMTLDIWNQRIKPHLAQFKSVHLVGIGEPLMNKHFFTFVEDVCHAGGCVHTTSNLQLVTEEIAARMVNKVAELSFSCDGASKESYEAIRRNGTFEKLHAALGHIVAAKARVGATWPVLTLNFGATRHNIRELPDVIRLARQYGVARVIAYHNIVYEEALKEESLYHDQALSDACFTEAAALCQQFGIQLLSPGLFRSPNHYTPGRIYCSYPFEHVYVYSDGRVGPCCMDFPDRLNLGNLMQAELPEIWNDRPLRDLRREMCTEPSYNCRYCSSHLRMDITDPRYFFRYPGADSYLARLLSERSGG